MSTIPEREDGAQRRTALNVLQEFEGELAELLRLAENAALHHEPAGSPEALLYAKIREVVSSYDNATKAVPKIGSLRHGSPT